MIRFFSNGGSTSLPLESRGLKRREREISVLVGSSASFLSVQSQKLNPCFKSSSIEMCKCLVTLVNRRSVFCFRGAWPEQIRLMCTSFRILWPYWFQILFLEELHLSEISSMVHCWVFRMHPYSVRWDMPVLNSCQDCHVVCAKIDLAGVLRAIGIPDCFRFVRM